MQRLKKIVSLGCQRRFHSDALPADRLCAAPSTPCTSLTYILGVWLPTLIATPRYDQDVAKLLPREEQDAMELAIAMAPEAHPVVTGLKGVRKARWARPGMGKRGGLRVAYYYVKSDGEILLLAAYPKNEKENLSDADKKYILQALKTHVES